MTEEQILMISAEVQVLKKWTIGLKAIAENKEVTQVAAEFQKEVAKEALSIKKALDKILFRIA